MADFNSFNASDLGDIPDWFRRWATDLENQVLDENSKLAIVRQPYKGSTYGDSRASMLLPGTLLVPTGSGNYISSVRSAIWAIGALGDVELTCNFGHGGDLATGWASTSRPDSKLFRSLISGASFRNGMPDVVFVQYGINDYIGGASAAVVAGAIQALCAALVGAGIKVVLEATYPASAANYGASAAAKLQATLDGNALLARFAAQYPDRIAFSDPTSLIVDATGYASAAYLPDGTHLNNVGAMLCGSLAATAARTILPARRSLRYSLAKQTQPNLIDWSAMASGSTLFAVSGPGTVTFNTPTWGYDADRRMPYAEVTMTCTALAGGYAQGRFEVHANTVSGATPRFPLLVGDELQGSVFAVVDDGAGNAPPIQGFSVRQRLYSDSKFADDGILSGTAAPTLERIVARRFTTPTFVTATASASISAPAATAGYSLQGQVEFNTAGQVARVRMYAPVLHVVNPGGLQPTQPTAGASPHTYTNTTGAVVMVYVAGGTVSSITIARQGTALTTGLVAGSFRLAQGDSITITYTVIPTLTVMPAELP